ncbi:MAG TPA: hypothetical protein VH302_09070 [Bryobacteraceae bacterium]|jgi:hypothetical protein|nr:hypothetical protein [Bryobacteraceae bacterium]
MNDDYLWDGTGEPDADLAHLEKVLGTLRWSTPRPGQGFSRDAWTRRPATRWIAAAATLIVVIGTAVLVRQLYTAHRLTSWQLSFSGEKPKPMYAGQLVETTENTRGTIQSELVGKVDIEPDSRVRLLAATADQQRLALDHGTIHAFIWAPPTQFVIDTPAAKAVDLGCQYTLHVDRTGIGLLTVQMGWVAFEWHGTESFIPAGAACTTRLGHGPDTPYFLDASMAFKNAIAEFDLHGSRQALSTALAEARKRDGLTLWHLLQRAPVDERGEVLDRFAQVVRMPPGISRDAILRGDRRSLDAAWNALNLGNTSWWREWTRQW